VAVTQVKLQLQHELSLSIDYNWFKLYENMISLLGCFDTVGIVGGWIVRYRVSMRQTDTWLGNK
jgi:hypothetical protein